MMTLFKFTFKCVLVFVGVVVLVGVFHEPILKASAYALRVEDATKPADIILIMGGNPMVRVPKAVELYQQGYAPKIAVIASQNSSNRNKLNRMGFDIPGQIELAQTLLLDAGVRQEAIINILGETATSTRQEAQIFKEYAQKNGVKKVILVTTSFHTRRARWAFRKALDDFEVTVQVAAAEPSGFTEEDWWQHEEGFLTYFNEYLKWAYYVINN